MISRENNFDLIRLFAAFQVAFHHGVGYLHINNPVINSIDRFLNFFPGVPIFFVISGFLIYSSYERNPDLKKYTINRILRLIPALWVCFGITLALLLFFDIIQYNDFFNGKILAWIFSQLTFMQVWTPESLKIWGMGVPNPSLQTISIEVQFYVLLPLLVVLLKNVLNRLNFKSKFSLLTFISMIFFILLFQKSSNIYYTLLKLSIFSSLFYFLLGSLSYLYFDKIKILVKEKVIYWFILYLILSYFLNNDFILTKVILSIIRAFLVISAAYSFVNIGKILKGNDISYGLYVYGMLIVNLFITLGYTHKPGYLFLALFLNILMGIASWFIIEKKALALKKIF